MHNSARNGRNRCVEFRGPAHARTSVPFFLTYLLMHIGGSKRWCASVHARGHGKACSTVALKPPCSVHSKEMCSHARFLVSVSFCVYVCVCVWSRCVQELLVHDGTDLTMKTRYGETPLHIACRKGKAKVVEKIVSWADKVGGDKLKALITQTDNDGVFVCVCVCARARSLLLPALSNSFSGLPVSTGFLVLRVAVLHRRCCGLLQPSKSVDAFVHSEPPSLTPWGPTPALFNPPHGRLHPPTHPHTPLSQARRQKTWRARPTSSAS